MMHSRAIIPPEFGSKPGQIGSIHIAVLVKIAVAVIAGFKQAGQAQQRDLIIGGIHDGKDIVGGIEGDTLRSRRKHRGVEPGL
jgi:hypothetical protein